MSTHSFFTIRGAIVYRFYEDSPGPWTSLITLGPKFRSKEWRFLKKEMTRRSTVWWRLPSTQESSVLSSHVHLRLRLPRVSYVSDRTEGVLCFVGASEYGNVRSSSLRSLLPLWTWDRNRTRPVRIRWEKPGHRDEGVLIIKHGTTSYKVGPWPISRTVGSPSSPEGLNNRLLGVKLEVVPSTYGTSRPRSSF